MDIQTIGRNYIMYQEAQTLGGSSIKRIRTFGIEDKQGNLVIYHKLALRKGEVYTENRPSGRADDGI